MPTPEEIAAAQKQKEEEAVAEATRLLKVKLELEEASDEAEIEIQTLKLKQIELANQAKMKKRAILKKALDDGLSSDKFPEFDFVAPTSSSIVSPPLSLSFRRCCCTAASFVSRFKPSIDR